MYSKYKLAKFATAHSNSRTSKAVNLQAILQPHRLILGWPAGSAHRPLYITLSARLLSFFFRAIALNPEVYTQLPPRASRVLTWARACGERRNRCVGDHQSAGEHPRSGTEPDSSRSHGLYGQLRPTGFRPKNQQVKSHRRLCFCLSDIL